MNAPAPRIASFPSNARRGRLGAARLSHGTVKRVANAWETWAACSYELKEGLYIRDFICDQSFGAVGCRLSI
jgi:hypothetical protein